MATKNYKEESEEGKPDPKEYYYNVAHQILQEDKFRLSQGSKELYFFDPNDGTYKNGLTYIEQRILEIMGHHYSTHAQREITAIIRIKCSYERGMPTPKQWINFKNGSYNLITGEFIKRTAYLESEFKVNFDEHYGKIRDLRERKKEYQFDPTPESQNQREKLDIKIDELREMALREKINWKISQKEAFSEFNFTSTLPVNYDPKAKCTAINEFFNSTLTRRENDVTRMYELFGYLLWKDQFMKTIFAFIGETNTGKSITGNLIVHFVGSDNVTSLSLKAIMEDKFDKLKLSRVMVNLSGELSSAFIRDTTVIKELTGNDPISARVMHSQEDFKFFPTLKFIFLMNKLPGTFEDDDAYFERNEIFEFLKQVKKGEDMDQDLIEKLTTPEELSGLLNMAIVGLKNLKKNGKFTGSLTTGQKKLLYQSKADPFTVFTNRIEISLIDTDFETKSEIWNKFVDFCKVLRVVPGTQNKFYRRFKAWARENEISEGKGSKITGESEIRTNGYYGISIKNYSEK